MLSADGDGVSGHEFRIRSTRPRAASLRQRPDRSLRTHGHRWQFLLALRRVHRLFGPRAGALLRRVGPLVVDERGVRARGDARLVRDQRSKAESRANPCQVGKRWWQAWYLADTPELREAIAACAPADHVVQMASSRGGRLGSHRSSRDVCLAVVSLAAVVFGGRYGFAITSAWVSSP